MKKTVLVLVLAALLLSTGLVSAQTTPAGDYWQEMLTIYEEWRAMEGESEATLTVNLPDEDEKTFHLQLTSTSDLEAFVSHMNIVVTSDDIDMVIPEIEMYTVGADFYVNTEAVLFFAELMGMGDALVIEQDFVLMQNTQTEMAIDTNFLMNMLEFIEGMEVELDMTFEDGTYHLMLDSDQMIDLLDTYMVYSMTNMDQLAQLTGQTAAMELTEEELAEALEAYQQMAGPMMDMARAAIAGSYYEQSTTFSEDGYEENTTLFVTSPFGAGSLELVSTAVRLESVEIELPTSFMVITEEDLTNLMMIRMPGQATQPAAMIDIDGGRYIKITGAGVQEGAVEIHVSTEGRSYMSRADAVAIFGLELEPTDEMMQIRDLQHHDFHVVWNEATRMVEVYNR
jgi:hypothetical protein